MAAHGDNSDTYRTLIMQADDRIREAEDAYLKASSAKFKLIAQAVNDGISQSEIARWLGVSRQRVQQMVRNVDEI